MVKFKLVMVLAASLAVALTGGCITGKKGPSDKELVAQTLGEWKAALEAQDIDKMLLCYSDSYQGDQGEGKAQLAEFLENVKTQGYLEGAEVDLEDAETVIENGIATVAPVDLSSDAGGLTLELKLKKDPDDIWRITGTGDYY